MKTTERVLEFLKTQGFCPEVDEHGGIIFKYQMATFLFINNDEDEEFFQLAMPHIYQVTDDNRDIVLEAANKTNTSMKVAKISVLDDSVWAFFEILLDQSPDVKHIIPRALNILMGARQTLYENLN
jgi:hypothetical protein